MGAILLTYSVSALGVGLFLVLSLPLPWLLGPMFACLVAALVGVPLRSLGSVTTLMRTVLGVAVGATITPALFSRMDAYLWSLAMMPLLVVVIGALGYPFFRRVMGFDHATAFYSAMPGGLQDMLLFGEEAGGDVRALSLIHATRVLIIVTVLPFLFTFWLGVDLNRPPGAPIGAIPVRELLIMTAAAIIGWKVAERIGLFGASILGPLFLTAALSLGDVIHQRPPAVAIQAAQFFLGIGIGAKYAGLSWRELRIDVSAGVGYTLISFLVAVGFAWIAIHTELLPLAEALLIFAPGGQGEMAIVALVMGADAAVVVAHHLTRIVFVITCAPLVSRWMERRVS